ncbi:C1 family peptidase [Leptothoe sp. ISB3NOV94-8A]
MGDRKTGWITDGQSLQDYQLENQEVRALLTRVKVTKQFIRFLEKAKQEITQNDEEILAATQQELSEENLIPRFFRSLKKWFTKDASSNELLNTSIKHLQNNIKQILANVDSDIELFDAELVIPNDYQAQKDMVNSDRIAPPIDTEISQHLAKILDSSLANLPKSVAFNHELLAQVEGALQELSPISAQKKAAYSKLIEDAFHLLPELIAKLSNAPILQELMQQPELIANFTNFTDSKMLKELMQQPELIANLTNFKNLISPTRPSGDKLKIRQFPLPTTDPDSVTGESKTIKLQLPLTRHLVNRITHGEDILLELPRVVDLSYWCSPVKDQGSLNACTSSAIASLVEYFQNRYAQGSSADGTFTPSHLSARFLYKVARRLGAGELGADAVKRYGRYLKTETGQAVSEAKQQALLQQLKADMEVAFTSTAQLQKYIDDEKIAEFMTDFTDIGASLRQTFKALQLFGIPQERYWPYTSSSPDFDLEPSPFCYAFAQSYQALKYFRLDPITENPGSPNEPTLECAQIILSQIKVILASGFPAVFGFIHDATYDQPYGKTYTNGGNIVCPIDSEKISALKQQIHDPNNSQVTGHAALAIGYDDDRRAFLIQNSWGTDWGKQGYGWLSYDYVLQGLATHWWTLLTTKWVEVSNYGLDTRLTTPIKTKKDK